MKLNEYGKQVSLNDGIWYAWPIRSEMFLTKFSTMCNKLFVRGAIASVTVCVRRHGKNLQNIVADKHWLPELLTYRLNDRFDVNIHNEADEVLKVARAAQQYAKGFSNGNCRGI